MAGLGFVCFSEKLSFKLLALLLTVMLVSVITRPINYSLALLGAPRRSAPRDSALPFSANLKKTIPFCCFSEEKGRIASVTGPCWSVEEEGKGAIAGEKFPRRNLFRDSQLLRVLLLGLPLPLLGGWFAVGFSVDGVKCREIITRNWKASRKGEAQSHCIRAQRRSRSVLLVC